MPRKEIRSRKRIARHADRVAAGTREDRPDDYRRKHAQGVTS